MLKCFILFIFTQSSAFAFACGGSKLEVLVVQKVRIDQKIELKKDWMDMPKALSIHSGNITSLRLNPKMKSIQIDMDWVGVKKELVQFKNDESVNYNLGQSFEKYYKKAKHLELSVLSNKAEICRQKIKLYEGD